MSTFFVSKVALSALTNLNAGLLYIAFAAIPLLIAVFSWQHSRKPGATPLAYAGVFAAAATVVQGFRFLDPLLGFGPWFGTVLHIGLLVAINLAVLGTLYIAVEYTGQRWLVNVWLILALSLLGTALPTARILAETADVASAGAIADGDFVYRLVVAVAALSLFARQFLSSRGVYRKQSGALLAGLGVGSFFGLLERFYSVQFVEFTLIGMTLGYVVLAWALFRYELLEAVPVARETLFDQVTDPVVALDETGRVIDLNSAAYDTFGVTDTIIGADGRELFQTDETLASRYEDILSGPKGVVGVVRGGRRHFVAEHPVLSALCEGTNPPETEVGILRTGTVQYFQVTVTGLELSPQYGGVLTVFRDVTRSTEREQDLDILKQVLTRVLRHNLRNDATAIQGYANAIARESEGEPRHMAERITRLTKNLTETSETARRIEDVIDAEAPEQFELAATLKRVIAETQEKYPHAVIDCNLSSDVCLVCNPELPAALSEVLENAIVHTGEEAHIHITGDRSGRWATVTVRDNGPGIPAHELEMLNRGEETPLVHGSGAGLWLIQLVVEGSNGDVSYDVDSMGTSVHIRLPVSDDAMA